MEVLIDSGLLKYYTHTVFKYQSFNIIVYLKGNKVIIKGTSSISRRKLFTYLWTSRRFPIAAKTALFLQSKYTLTLRKSRVPQVQGITEVPGCMLFPL